MPISDGKNMLQKIAFQIGPKFFRFAINPESYSHSNPHRTTAIKTKSRIVIEDFQSDIPTISISGSTGFNPTGRAQDKGVAKIKEMKKFLEDYAKTGGNGKMSSEDFYFHNFTNDESFVVHLSPEGVTYNQGVESPLTFAYEIKFVVLRKASEPADEDVVNPVIGNRYPSPAYNPTVPNNIGGIAKPTPQTPIGPSPDYSDWLNPQPAGPSTDDVYNKGDNNPYSPTIGTEAINPQAPSNVSYQYGMTGVGYALGYYGRSY